MTVLMLILTWLLLAIVIGYSLARLFTFLAGDDDEE